MTDVPIGGPPRCTKHGLAYDPAVSDGCVVCRRERGSVAPPREERGTTIDVKSALTGVVVVFGVLLGSYYGWKWYANSKRAQIGERCTAKWGCVEGAQCMGKAGDRWGMTVEGPTFCVATCTADTQCATADRCMEGLCKHVARVGQACNEWNACTEGTACISVAGTPHACRTECASDVGCGAGEACLRSPGPLGLPSDTGYCVPAALAPPRPF